MAGRCMQQRKGVSITASELWNCFVFLYLVVVDISILKNLSHFWDSKANKCNIFLKWKRQSQITAIVNKCATFSEKGQSFHSSNQSNRIRWCAWAYNFVCAMIGSMNVIGRYCLSRKIPLLFAYSFPPKKWIGIHQMSVGMKSSSFHSNEFLSFQYPVVSINRLRFQTIPSPKKCKCFVQELHIQTNNILIQEASLHFATSILVVLLVQRKRSPKVAFIQRNAKAKCLIRFRFWIYGW